MKKHTLCLGWGLALISSACASASVVINEVFINPPSSADDVREFIELMGTPGMKLDGYAIVLVNGGLTKYYPLGSIPPRPIAQEIDEFFSLDGLQLGPNGLLVIGIGAAFNYPTLLSDTNFQRWNTIWNGGLDAPGKLNNDGSNTILLIRNRPGATQADPENPAGLLWGKDVNPDDELITPVVDPQDGVAKDQYGDGNVDKGQPNNIDGNTRDFKGASTPLTLTDDLEIVDEVSYEQDRGWEYDLDDRRVDLGSSHGGLKPRNVHALGDPQGFNPDCLTRVDYRTKGPGWAPAGGGTGQLPNGHNWQDTATEQWIRGESIPNSGSTTPPFFYDNATNTNPDAIQPYMTNVPSWLADGVAPDFNFAVAKSYEIMAGRVNPLAVPFIPGDVDRDGDCDAEDVAKLAAVFGNPDWIFSNSYEEAPEGDEGDPATQTRPWDVDGTGDHGIEASDLQWVLNFQGNTTGRIVGRVYDSTTPTPAGGGVYLNPNVDITCAVTLAAYVPSGRPVTALEGCDVVQITVYGEVVSGAILTPDQQNGIMQYVHDVLLSAGGVMRVASIEPLGDFSKTRAALETPQGVGGDLGVQTVNGYTTSFDRGLAGPTPLYRVTLAGTGVGTTTLTVAPAAHPGMQASTPHGLKVGRTAANGNPAGGNYSGASLTLGVVSAQSADVNGDSIVDLLDVSALVATLLGDPTHLARSDFNCDGLVDGRDVQPFVDLFLP